MKKSVKNIRSATHFVGFTDTKQYHTAIKTFGEPDFIHRKWDKRAKQEVVDGDKVIFAKGTEHDDPGNHPSYDDSEEFAKDHKGRIPNHKDYMKEDAPTNSVSGGGVAGMTEPVVRKGKFAGNTTFIFKRNKYNDFLHRSKKDRQWWKTYIGEDECYVNEIRNHIKSNPHGPIVFENEDTGELFFARYGKKKC